MSFSSDVKIDLIKVMPKDRLERLAELEAMLRFGGEVMLGRPLRIEFTCNQMNVIRKFITLCKEVNQIEYEIESRVINRFDNHAVFTCEIREGAEEIIRLFDLINIESDMRNNMSPKMMAAYLRGAFLVRGSVNDPASKDSHLEISTTNENEILFIQKLMNEFELNARIIKRKSYLVAYIKAHEAIGDFLYRVGASSVMNYYNDAIITKEIKATAQRTVNLDIANQDKTNDAAREQLKYIQYLEYNYPLEKMDNKLLMIMKVRKDYPEHSLTQLLDVIHEEYDPKLSKSGLNHRLRKLKELAIEYEQSKN